MENNNWFVPETNPLRRIWSKADAILVIFAGSAAEFALNKAVDWLYFTGRLPADPLGRLFSTVAYARRIIFAERAEAEKAICQIVQIHQQVEQARAQQIPAWAYRDVLYMLIHYSIAAAELLDKPLSPVEKEEVYAVFREMGSLMSIPALPPNYQQWLPDYEQHLQHDLACSTLTYDLFKQYRKHLGSLRYQLLLQTQSLVIPPPVRDLLSSSRPAVLPLLLPSYRFLRNRNRTRWIQWLLVPPVYRQQVAALDVQH